MLVRLRLPDLPVACLIRHGAGGSARRPGFGCGIGFASPLTRMVATPCYRAPEVGHLLAAVAKSSKLPYVCFCCHC